MRADNEKVFTPLQDQDECQHTLVGFFPFKKDAMIDLQLIYSSADPLCFHLNQIDRKYEVELIWFQPRMENMRKRKHKKSMHSL